MAGAITVMLNRPAVLRTGNFIVHMREPVILTVDHLYKKKFINNQARVFMHLFLRANNSNFRFGEYLLSKDMSIYAVIKRLHRGDVYYRKISFPEGLTATEMAKIITAEDNLLGDWSEMIVEGSLMPDTYYFAYGETRDGLVKRMKDAMQNFLETEWRRRDSGLPMKTQEEALILASIVEKESKHGLDQAKVAAVFHNRLHRGMRLQSCPTAIYNITRGNTKFTRSLSLKDLAVPGVYNTYRNAGLPPTPISNPGRSAILAVLHPYAHKALYFTLAPDGEGHIFSDNYDEHLVQVKKIRKALRSK